MRRICIFLRRDDKLEKFGVEKAMGVILKFSFRYEVWFVKFQYIFGSVGSLSEINSTWL